MANDDTTLQQKRAAHALRKVKELKQPGLYVSYVSALPSQILMNGLGQAMAMLLATAGRRSKGDPTSDAHYLLCSHVTHWLGTCGHINLDQATDPIDVLQKLMTSDENVYLQAKAEALAYLEWLKKFARAVIPEKVDSDKSSDDNTDTTEQTA